MLDIKQLTKLAEDWFKTVPDDMKDKVIVASYSIKPMSFTPRQIVSKVKAAARKAKTRAVKVLPFSLIQDEIASPASPPTMQYLQRQ